MADWPSTIATILTLNSEPSATMAQARPQVVRQVRRKKKRRGPSVRAGNRGAIVRGHDAPDGSTPTAHLPFFDPPIMPIPVKTIPVSIAPVVEIDDRIRDAFAALPPPVEAPIAATPEVDDPRAGIALIVGTGLAIIFIWALIAMAMIEPRAARRPPRPPRRYPSEPFIRDASTDRRVIHVQFGNQKRRLV
jgi:hypothetical protein